MVKNFYFSPVGFSKSFAIWAVCFAADDFANGVVRRIRSVEVWVRVVRFSRSFSIVLTMGSIDLKYGMNSGTNWQFANMFTSDRKFVLMSHHPRRCQTNLLDWYIMTMGQPAAATWSVALPLATMAKSALRVVSATEPIT